ncbi:S8 family peptidase [Duganella fentianensis]|uniref:S8 family peptidase n=1 Tax=Duganella fentianensis TaxID=2692177 RepID=UPI0032B0F0FD
MAATNIILGYGETLTRPHPLKRGPGDKKYPYEIGVQRQWLGEQLDLIAKVRQAESLALKPRGESVARFTLHPAFLAKTYHPNALLQASGLRCVGSRSAMVKPRNVASTRQKAGEPNFTAALYVAGDDGAFTRLANMLQSSRTAQTHQLAFCRFEMMETFSAKDKDLVTRPADSKPLLEVVLHASEGDNDIVDAFAEYVASLDGTVDVARVLVISGLTFVPVRIDPNAARALAAFHFVRAVRVMPSLRIGGRDMRSSSAPAPLPPFMPAINTELKVAVFDGGLGHTNLSPWVKETVLLGAEATSAAYLNHGNAVTSSLLFGPIDEAATHLPQPYANVHHYRCISPDLQAPSGVPDADLYDVLKHIDQVLKNDKPSFINLSIGPYMPIEDDEVHPWTALLDSHLASGDILATVAVGNDGEKDWPESRVQPPSDMVNAIAVGACDTKSTNWMRAPYSSHGPGRTPGMVKPDGVGFGGSDNEPFVVYNALTGQYSHTTGTSFSSPATLRTAIGVKVSLNSPLSLLAVRALMSHHASRPKTMLMSHVGHGRFPQNAEEVLTCDDNEVRVIYQGTLKAGENLRALIPFPTLPLNGKVTLRATLCFASQTDPEHAINYTRAGLTVMLRPKHNRKETIAFFSSSKMYTSELEARIDDQKWETTLKHEQRFNADTLHDPMFDITYGAREDGKSVDNKSLPPLPYAMVVTVSAEDTPGVYNNIRQRYQTLQPVEVHPDIRIKTASGQS